MNASQDNNFVKAKLAVLNTDGKTIVPIKIKSANGAMIVNFSDTIGFTMTPVSHKDDNFNNVLMFKGTDGKTYPFVANSSGELLISL